MTRTFIANQSNDLDFTNNMIEFSTPYMFPPIQLNQPAQPIKQVAEAPSFYESVSTNRTATKIASTATRATATGVVATVRFMASVTKGLWAGVQEGLAR